MCAGEEQVMMNGRRPTYSAEQVAEYKKSLLVFIQNKGTLLAWCRMDGNPGYDTVYKWIDEDENFAEDYRRARSIQGHRMADEIIELGHTEPDVARAALLVSAYKWAAPKFNIEYSERSTTDIINSDGSFKNSPEKLEQRLTRIFERARTRMIEKREMVDVTPKEPYDGSDLV